MIKWFKAYRFLPGKEVGEVLIRAVNSDDVALYYVGEYFSASDDWDMGSDWISNTGYKITHWAFIEEPFE